MTTDETALFDALKKLQSEKKSGISVNSIDYGFIYDAIQSGAICSDTVNLNSSNYLFELIKKMKKDDFLKMSSREPEKQKFRKFFQNIGRGEHLSESEKKQKQSDYWNLLRKIHALRTKK